MKILRSLATMTLIFVFTTNLAQAAVHWGNWKKDGCSRPGYRQYSSVLWDIPWGSSWELTCSHTPVNGKTNKHGLPGHAPDFRSPRSCKKAGGHMWGEIDVRDHSCDLKKTAPKLSWGDFKKDHCMGNHVRQYSAKLMHVPMGMSWESACAAARGIPYGSTAGSRALVNRLKSKGDASKADRCKKGEALGIAAGIWGEFDVADSSCQLDLSQLKWGRWARGDCISVPLSLDDNGQPSGARYLRPYWSVLWDIPAGQSWEAACAAMPVSIPYGNNKQLKRPHPDVCAKTTGNQLIKYGSMIALTAASQIKGLGEKAKIGLEVAGVAIDLIADSGTELGAFNIKGVVYDQDPTCHP